MNYKIFVLIAFLVAISFTVSGQTKKDFGDYIDYPRLNSISRNFDLPGISNNNFKKGFARHFLFFNDSMKNDMDSSANRSKTPFQKPKLDFSRLPLEFLAGNALGVVSGLVGGLIAVIISGDKLVNNEGAPFNIATALGLTIFHTAGSIAGVYFTGVNNEIENKIGWTIIGGLIGTGVELLCLHLEFKSENKPGFAPVLLTTTLPTIGSMVGFHTSMEYKNPGSKINSLLNFESGKIHLKIPNVKLHRLFYIGIAQNTSNSRPQLYYTSLSLLSYNF